MLPLRGGCPLAGSGRPNDSIRLCVLTRSCRLGGQSVRSRRVATSGAASRARKRAGGEDGFQARFAVRRRDRKLRRFRRRAGRRAGGLPRQADQDDRAGTARRPDRRAGAAAGAEDPDGGRAERDHRQPRRRRRRARREGAGGRRTRRTHAVLREHLDARRHPGGLQESRATTRRRTSRRSPASPTAT